MFCFLSEELKGVDFEQMLKKLTNVPSAAVVPDAWWNAKEFSGTLCSTEKEGFKQGILRDTFPKSVEPEGQINK